MKEERVHDIEAIKTKLWARIREHQDAGGAVRNSAMYNARGGEPGLYSATRNGKVTTACILGVWINDPFDADALAEDVAGAALGLTWVEVEALEAGFENWGRGATRDLERHYATDDDLFADPLYRLGAEVASVLDEEERRREADAHE